MQFSREFLRELCDGGDYVHKERVGSSRWVDDYWAVFEYDGRLYSTNYSRGKTEMQESRPYDDDEDVIECAEVVAVKEVVEVTRYVNV